MNTSELSELLGDLFVLDDDGEAVKFDGDIRRWAEVFERTRRVAVFEHGASIVSTVFLGMMHSGGMFETMIFGGAFDEECERYKTKAEALAGHQRWCDTVRAWEDAQSEGAAQ